jgi:TPR repeat protein
MTYDEFENKYNQLLRTGDEQILVEIKSNLSQSSEPACFELIGYLHDPMCINHVDHHEIKTEIKNKFIDDSEALRYKKLAFEAYKTRAESGDLDYMSHLADLYILGEGTEKNQEKADYWLDKLYLEKTGIKFKEWKVKNA